MAYKARDHRSIRSRIIFSEFSAPANNVVSQLILCRRKFYQSYIYKRKFQILSSDISVIVIFFLCLNYKKILMPTYWQKELHLRQEKMITRTTCFIEDCNCLHPSMVQIFRAKIKHGFKLQFVLPDWSVTPGVGLPIRINCDALRDVK